MHGAEIMNSVMQGMGAWRLWESEMKGQAPVRGGWKSAKFSE
jgi:hypothetical protein